MSHGNESKIFSMQVAIVAISLSALFASDAFANSRSYYHREKRDEYRSSERTDQLGILGGPTFNSADASVPPGLVFESTSRTLFDVSVFYEHQFMPFFGIRFEGGYTQRGFTQATGVGDQTIDYSASYLEFPIQFKAQIPTGFVTPFLATGPFAGFLVGNSATINQDGTSTQGSLDGILSNFEFGWNFGGGLDFNIDRRVSLELSLRYSLALTNAIQSQAAIQGGLDSLQLDSVQFLGGFVFVI